MLILLIVSVAVHVAMVGWGCCSSVPKARAAALLGRSIRGRTDDDQRPADLGGAGLDGADRGALPVLRPHLYGKALRATAINRNGARLMGISPALAGKLTFFLAALIGALSGVLIAPLTTIYYDTGFLIGLKGFVGAIIGGLGSYPIAPRAR